MPKLHDDEGPDSCEGVGAFGPSGRIRAGAMLDQAGFWPRLLRGRGMRVERMFMARVAA